MRFMEGDVFSVGLPERKFLFVYADPPYANCRFRYARHNSSRQWGRDGRADFLRSLIARMESLRQEDGCCAVSLSTNELRLFNLFPSRARVLAWVKPYAPIRPHVWPAYSWEPVILWGKLPGRAAQRAAQTPKDWLQLSPRVPEKNGHETPKPEPFAEWLLTIALGQRRGDVCDLFAGTATLARAAEKLGCRAVAVDVRRYSR